MQIKISYLLGILLVALSFAPVTMLYADRQNPVSLPVMTITNPTGTHRASTLFNNIENLARRVRRELGPLQIDELQFALPSQASKFNYVRSEINRIGDDLLQLDAMQKKLEPWQKQLLDRLTPHVHELVYQTDAAINQLKVNDGAAALALTQYPQNINVIERQTGQIIRSVGTFNQYQIAKAKLAKLELHSSRASS